MIINCSGGRGDIIYALAFLPYYGFDNELVIHPKKIPPGFVGTKYSGPEITEADVLEFKDFLTKQIYIKDVSINKIYDLDLDNFRVNIKLMDSIMGAYAATYKIPDSNWRVSTNGWIDPTVYRKTKNTKPILINKTLRYHSNNFNWWLLNDYINDIGFIGSEAEHETFERNYFKVDYIKTETITDLARSIYSSKLLVCNQSFAYTLAEAAAHPRILENYDNLVLPYTHSGFIDITKERIESIVYA